MTLYHSKEITIVQIITKQRATARCVQNNVAQTPARHRRAWAQENFRLYPTNRPKHANASLYVCVCASLVNEQNE